MNFKRQELGGGGGARDSAGTSPVVSASNIFHRPGLELDMIRSRCPTTAPCLLASLLVLYLLPGQEQLNT